MIFSSFLLHFLTFHPKSLKISHDLIGRGSTLPFNVQEK
jgi:hypothetical protein